VTGRSAEPALPERDILLNEVSAGKLMQVATLGADGSPALCHIWYRPTFAPDRLYFVSRLDRQHSVNIRADGRVAGGIVATVPGGLGDKVRGVTFQGTAVEIPARGFEDLVKAFLDRWPNASAIISVDRLERGETQARLYEITVTNWVLFDERDFPDQPRRSLPAHG
jgi:Pyridoxamine 5'-phosphate oxidase